MLSVPKGMSMASQIGLDHPSFGYEQAWFLFALTNKSGAMVRLFVVEAHNPWAIQTLERIVLHDGRVSTNCGLVSVSRHASMDTRSSLITKVRYVDFMLDIVEPDYLMRDALITSSFEQSLSPEEKQYANAKLDAMVKLERAKPRLVPMGPPPPKYPMPPEMRQLPAPMVIDTTAEVFDAESSVVYQQAVAALTDLGFKKPQVKKVLSDLGGWVTDNTIENVIKKALQQLQAA